MEKLEYMLWIWRAEPELLANPEKDHVKVHVTNAPRIPSIGESIEDEEDNTVYRVFDVYNPIGTGLRKYFWNGNPDEGPNPDEVHKVDISSLEDQHITVFAYLENAEDSEE